MAKKKKPVKKKKVDAKVEQSPFWALSGAIGLMILGFLLLLGGFGIGGPLPVKLFEGAYWALAWAAYITPLAAAYWGVYKFKAEDHQIPLNKLVAMLAVLFFASSWFYVTFASKNEFGEWTGGHGGELGHGVGNVTLTLLSQIPASLVFIVLTVLSVFFAFGISPKVLAKVADLFKKEQSDEDNDLAALKAKAAEQPGFKLNEGVPVVHHARFARRMMHHGHTLV